MNNTRNNSKLVIGSITPAGTISISEASSFDVDAVAKSFSTQLRKRKPPQTPSKKSPQTKTSVRNNNLTEEHRAVQQIARSIGGSSDDILSQAVQQNAINETDNVIVRYNDAEIQEAVETVQSSSIDKECAMMNLDGGYVIEVDAENAIQFEAQTVVILDGEPMQVVEYTTLTESEDIGASVLREEDVAVASVTGEILGQVEGNTTTNEILECVEPPPKPKTVIRERVKRVQEEETIMMPIENITVANKFMTKKLRSLQPCETSTFKIVKPTKRASRSNSTLARRSPSPTATLAPPPEAPEPIVEDPVAAKPNIEAPGAAEPNIEADPGAILKANIKVFLSTAEWRALMEIGWFSSLSSFNMVQLLRINRETNEIVPVISVIVELDCALRVSVLGRDIATPHPAIVFPENIENVNALYVVLKGLNRLNICRGNPEVDIIQYLIESKRGFYSAVTRAQHDENCQRLTERKICVACAKLRNSVYSLVSRRPKLQTKKIRSYTKEELIDKVKDMRRTEANLKRKIQRLVKRLELTSCEKDNDDDDEAEDSEASDQCDSEQSSDQEES